MLMIAAPYVAPYAGVDARKVASRRRRSRPAAPVRSMRGVTLSDCGRMATTGTVRSGPHAVALEARGVAVVVPDVGAWAEPEMPGGAIYLRAAGNVRLDSERLELRLALGDHFGVCEDCRTRC